MRAATHFFFVTAPVHAAAAGDDPCATFHDNLDARRVVGLDGCHVFEDWETANHTGVY